MRKRNDVFVKSERLTCDDSRALRAEYQALFCFYGLVLCKPTQ
jgi:hypothetical protein